MKAKTEPPAGSNQSDQADYRIKLGAGNPPAVILYTAYKGHAFEGWHSTEKMRRIESAGVLAWDADGNPVINGTEG